MLKVIFPGFKYVGILNKKIKIKNDTRSALGQKPKKLYYNFHENPNRLCFYVYEGFIVFSVEVFFYCGGKKKKKSRRVFYSFLLIIKIILN